MKCECQRIYVCVYVTYVCAFVHVCAYVYVYVCVCICKGPVTLCNFLSNLSRNAAIARQVAGELHSVT